MWRLWGLFAVALGNGVGISSVCGEEFLEGGDVGFLEQRLDDVGLLGEVAVRWRVRGAEGAWERLQVYQRVEWRLGERQAFFALAERDPGEEDWSDFRSFYYRIGGGKGELVIGDVRPGFGAGLVFGRNRRGGVPAAMPGDDSGRLGYRSSGENSALRGVVWRYGAGEWEGALVGGWARRDGRLNGAEDVSSLPESGYHVTETEVAGRDLLAALVGGGRLRWRGGGWQWGVTALGLHLSRKVDLRRGGRTPWGFVGEGQRLGAVDGRVVWDGGWVGFEAARDGAGHWGIVGAARSRVGSVRLRMLGRYYAPGFHSFFGAAPGASGMQNEFGGVAVLAGRGWRAYADGYRRPERSYFVPVAANYFTWGAEIERRLRVGFGARARWQGRARPRWREGQMVSERGHKLRLDLSRAIWRWRAEVQRLRVRDRVEWGLLGSLRLKARWVTVHLSRFRTASYQTRLYEYEADLPGAVSIRPLYGAGWRLYGLVSITWRGVAWSGRYRLQRDREFRRYGGVQIDWRRGDIDKR